MVLIKNFQFLLPHNQLGLNIDPTGAPVDACGLTTDLGITDVETFAKNVMKRYIEEDTEISEATSKVRGV